MSPPPHQIAAFHALIVGPALVYVGRAGKRGAVASWVYDAMAVAGAAATLYHSRNLYRWYTAPPVEIAAAVLVVNAGEQAVASGYKKEKED